MKNKETIKIYLLTNIKNGKIYVGQTWLTLEKRMGKGKNYNNSPYLHFAIQKYGYENFEYVVLAECFDQDIANETEKYYIEYLNSRDPNIGYNIKEGGANGKHSEETKKKISQSLIGREVSEETRQKLSVSCTGREMPPHTEEWKEENSIRTIEWHANNTHPMLGKHHTEETKVKIGEASKGRVMPPESVAKGAKARQIKEEKEQEIIKYYKENRTIEEIEQLTGKGRSTIYRVLDRNNTPRSKNFTKWTGKKHSPETKQKMSDAKTEYWKNN